MGYNIFEAIAQLSDVKRDALHRACEQDGLSPAAMSGVEEAARLLMDYQQNGRHRVQTRSARERSMSRLAMMAEDLRTELEKLEPHECSNIEDEMRRQLVNLGIRRKHDQAPTGVHVMGLKHDLKLFSAGAGEIAKRIPVGNGRGRADTSAGYYLGVEWLWRAVSDEGVNLAASGKFLRLCNAAFAAAGIPATAVGAVRNFIETRGEQAEFHKAYYDRFAE